MANDRIYLKCRCCGETLYLGKSMADGFYYPKRPDRLEDLLNDFYEKHTFCIDGDEGDYEITYESEKEKPKQKTIGPCKVCIQTPSWCPLMKEK